MCLVLQLILEWREKRGDKKNERKASTLNTDDARVLCAVAACIDRIPTTSLSFFFLPFSFFFVLGRQSEQHAAKAKGRRRGEGEGKKKNCCWINLYKCLQDCLPLDWIPFVIESHGHFGDGRYNVAGLSYSRRLAHTQARSICLLAVYEEREKMDDVGPERRRSSKGPGRRRCRGSAARHLSNRCSSRALPVATRPAALANVSKDCVEFNQQKALSMIN